MRSVSRPDQFSLLTSIASQGNSATEHHYEYMDRTALPLQTYWYYLVDVDANGTRTEHRELMRSASLASREILPADYDLVAYPNPFNPSSAITFSLPDAQPVRIIIYDVAGREVRQLADHVFVSGTHRVVFDGAELPSGVYIVRLDLGSRTRSIKLLLLK
jgi:hypothetical protein